MKPSVPGMPIMRPRPEDVPTAWLTISEPELSLFRADDIAGDYSAGGYFELFWKFQTPADYLFSGIKGITMATFVVMVGCYYGYTASGGPVGVGRNTAKSMVVNIVSVHIIGMLGTQIFWGANPRAPIGG